MEWIVDNWAGIVLVVSVVANIFVAAGWTKAAKYLRIVITGVNDYVEATGNKSVETTIKARSVAAGTEGGLNPIVMKVKGGWKSALDPDALKNGE